MSYEYLFKINHLIYNLLCIKNLKSTNLTDIRKHFPQAVMSIIVPNTLGMKKFPRMKKFLITTNAF